MTKKTYTLDIDYQRSLEEVIKLGKYDRVHEIINDYNFPTEQRDIDKDVALFNFKKNMSSENVIKAMQEEGYEPATVYELAWFGVKYPSVQREHIISALDQLWIGSEEIIYVASLYGRSLRRTFGFDFWLDDWDDCYYFLAVREVSDHEPSEPAISTFDTMPFYLMVNGVKYVRKTDDQTPAEIMKEARNAFMHATKLISNR